MRRIALVTAALPLFATTCATPAFAAETLTYKYDARGRLIRVERGGPVNKATVYTYDRANNRLRKATTP